MPICTECGAIINKKDIENHIHNLLPVEGKELIPTVTEKK